MVATTSGPPLSEKRTLFGEDALFLQAPTLPKKMSTNNPEVNGIMALILGYLPTKNNKISLPLD
jgi:hypothetical protein